VDLDGRTQVEDKTDMPSGSQVGEGGGGGSLVRRTGSRYTVCDI
jgi:hypothetical protein